MAWSDQLALFWHYLALSTFAVGGVPTVIPDMQRYVVEVHPWMSAQEFGEVFALVQVAPGPGVMFVTVIGWLLAGWSGALLLTIAMFLPGIVMTSLMIKFNMLDAKARFGRALRKGLAPVTIGLVLASCWVLTTTVNHDVKGYVLTALTIGMVLKTKLNPLWLIGAGALIGIAGLV
ncbi:MAG: chromate transporter [Burkholderiales bacterium]